LLFSTALVEGKVELEFLHSAREDQYALMSISAHLNRYEMFDSFDFILRRGMWAMGNEKMQMHLAHLSSLITHLSMRCVTLQLSTSRTRFHQKSRSEAARGSTRINLTIHATSLLLV